MMTFDENKVAEQYRLYKLRQEEKLKAEAAEKLAREKRQAEFQAVQAQLQKACAAHPATVRKKHECTGCGAVIPAGSRVIVEGEVQTVFFMYSQGASLKRFISHYYCNACRKAEA